MTKAWVQIHVCVVLWGFTPILGRLISLPAPQLVWWRMVLVTAALLVAPGIWRDVRRLPWRLIAAYGGIGCLVALHWAAFYTSVKLANASVAATCIAIGPLLLAFLEPWIARRPFNAVEVMLGLLAIPGVALVVGGTPAGMRLGIVAGVAAAGLAAVFSSFNKRLVARAGPLSITAIEMGAGVLLLTALVPVLTPAGPPFVVPDRRDALLLVTLSMACTLLPFALSFVALRHLTAFGTMLAVNLEPVYAVLLAIPLLGEQRELHGRFYVGVALILSVVFVYPVVSRRPRLTADALLSPKP